MERLGDEISGLRVLVVEDDDLVRELVVRAAIEMGAIVDAVCNGHEAMSHLGDQPYDAVVTDLKMPKVTGLDVLEVARKCGRPVGLVVMTGFADVSDERAIARLGAVLLRKPFRAAELAEALALCSQHRVCD